MSEPNDILIRFTKDANGKIVKAVEMGVNDDSLLPEMTKTADFITQCLAIQDSRLGLWMESILCALRK